MDVYPIMPIEEVKQIKTSDELAHVKLIETAKKYSGKLNLFITGPLTNFAMALKMDPSLPHELKRVVIMGGSLPNNGNATKNAEYNFISDVYALKIVLDA